MVSIIAIGLQFIGWSSLFASKLGHRNRLASLAHLVLLVSLTGLGAATLIAAAQQTACALTTGAGITLLALAVIAQPQPSDPYSAIYPPERVG